MNRRLLFTLIIFCLLAGTVVGISLQKYSLPGKVIQQTISILASSGSKVDEKISDQSDMLNLRVRDFNVALDPDMADTEKDGRYVYYIERIPISQLALILIDVWAQHPNDGWMLRANENIRFRLVPLLDAVRRHGIQVIHSPNGQQIHELVNPSRHEMVVDGPNQQKDLTKLLEQRGIRYLLYAGYASNMCMLHRTTGIIDMFRNRYKIIFVRDASLAIEAPKFFEKKITHEVAVYIIESNYGVTTTVDDILAALRKPK